MTTVERFDDESGTWVSVDNYGSFEIEFGVSDVLVAPEATITLPRTAPVSAGTRIRIRESGETIFEGDAVRTKPRSNGPMRVDLEHDAYGLFEQTVDLSVSGTDRDVLEAALDEALGSWTLAYPGTVTPLGDTYEADGRTVKRVFRDMVDRVGRIWWVGVDDTITVAPLGDGGLLASVDTSTDAARVEEYTPDDTDTVVNDVTVIGTGGEKVEATASNAPSVNEYGFRPERVNVDYIRSESEANDYAAELLNPEPYASATVTVGASVADVAGPVVNQELDVTDEQGTGMDERLPIEKQVVTQGSAELDLGAGSGVNVAKFNRSEKSKADVTEEGSVYGGDRIGDGAIDEEKLVDLSVTEQKLADLAVATEKLRDNAVINGKLDDLSVSETKIQDDSISTPKLIAEAVTASEIESDTITAAQIAAGAITALEIQSETITAGEIAAGAITALEIQSGTITAGEIDTLELSTGQLTLGVDNDDGIEFTSEGADGATRTAIIPTSDVAFVGTDWDRFRGTFSSLTSTTIIADGVSPRVVPDSDESGQVGESDRAFDAMYAYDFIDASTGDSITDGGDPLRGLSTGHGPPDTAAVRDGSGGLRGYSVSGMAREAWDVIRAQQRLIEELESRIDELEAAVDPNA